MLSAVHCRAGLRATSLGDCQYLSVVIDISRNMLRRYCWYHDISSEDLCPAATSTTASSASWQSITWMVLAAVCSESTKHCPHVSPLVVANSATLACSSRVKSAVCSTSRGPSTSMAPSLSLLLHLRCSRCRPRARINHACEDTPRRYRPCSRYWARMPMVLLSRSCEVRSSNCRQTKSPARAKF